ncbi:MAG: hypothetical protein ACOCVR_04330, partial [Myxococcota bacterium]
MRGSGEKGVGGTGRSALLTLAAALVLCPLQTLADGGNGEPEHATDPVPSDREENPERDAESPPDAPVYETVVVAEREPAPGTISVIDEADISARGARDLA